MLFNAIALEMRARVFANTTYFIFFGLLKTVFLHQNKTHPC
jgi:hypothetical protein